MLQVSHETAPTPVFEIKQKCLKLKIVIVILRELKTFSKTGVGEEGEDDARSACPFDTLGCTHNTIAVTTRSDGATLSESFKNGVSSDWSLQLDSMKLELLVIAHQHGAVNTFPGLVHTARQAMEAGSTRNRCANPQGRQASKVRPVTGAKS